MNELLQLLYIPTESLQFAAIAAGHVILAAITLTCLHWSKKHD